MQVEKEGKRDWEGGKRREKKVKGVVSIGVAREGPWGRSPPPKGVGKNCTTVLAQSINQSGIAYVAELFQG